jgi:hypothetical protein
MNVSHENAQESLSTVQDVTVRTHRAIASAYASDLLILWGALWTIEFTAAHFYPAYAFHIFMVMSIVGCIGTAVIYWVFYSKALIREAGSQSAIWRIALFWILLYAYAALWHFLLAPFNGLQGNAFISTVAMFAFVVIGLWFGCRFMIILGLAVTIAVLIGFYLLTAYYCLWMALMGGGAILGTGLYTRLRWR